MPHEEAKLVKLTHNNDYINYVVQNVSGYVSIPPTFLPSCSPTPHAPKSLLPELSPLPLIALHCCPSSTCPLLFSYQGDEVQPYFRISFLLSTAPW